MKLTLVRHLWGVDLSTGYKPHLAHWREAGYGALEASLRLVSDAHEFRRVLREEGFLWIPQVFSNMFEGGGTVAKHLSTMREQIQECIDSGPLFFNVQSGSDSWTIEEAEDFYGAAARIEAEFGIALTHETHRSRYFGNPWNTIRFLDRMPEIKLTCDFSHWVCVAERLLPDAGPIFQRVARNCYHLHARVGYEQGPQVPDPRAPEWMEHLHVHEHWWEEIWSAQRSLGKAFTTLTPEFGPPPYLHALPFSQEPVADLEAICDWMAERQVRHFAGWQKGQDEVRHPLSVAGEIS